MSQSGDSRTVSTTLLMGLKNHDNHAYERLQDVFHDTIARRLRRLGVAEDALASLTNDVFYRIWRGIDRFERDADGRSFRRWLFTIVRTSAMDHFRKPGFDQLETDRLAEVPDPLDDDEESNDIAGEVHRMLESVRGDFQEHTYLAFVRYWLEGLETEQIAREFDMTKNAVRSSRDRVMKRLRELYFDLYGDDWPFSDGTEDWSD